MNQTRKRILFVDDEPAVLKGLANVLRQQRDRWDMTFVVGGGKAIEVLRAGRFDAVVTDMRMPGIDGASLLTWVKHAAPHTVRVMLTGSVDLPDIDADVILAKPCDANVLRSHLDRLLNASEA